RYASRGSLHLDAFKIDRNAWNLSVHADFYFLTVYTLQRREEGSPVDMRLLASRMFSFPDIRRRIVLLGVGGSALAFLAVAHQQPDRCDQLVDGFTVEGGIGARFGLVGMLASGIEMVIYRGVVAYHHQSPEGLRSGAKGCGWKRVPKLRDRRAGRWFAPYVSAAANDSGPCSIGCPRSGCIASAAGSPAVAESHSGYRHTCRLPVPD